MTHSHDRTLLASLGFADPDRNEPEHDQACRYLAEKAQTQRLVDLVMPTIWKPAKISYRRQWLWAQLEPFRSRLREVGLYISVPPPSSEARFSGEVTFDVDAKDAGCFPVVDDGMGYRITRPYYWSSPEHPSAVQRFERNIAAFDERESLIRERMKELEAVEPFIRAHGSAVEMSGRETEARWRPGKPQLESPIQKGEGKYRTTIGWADVLFVADESIRCIARGTAPDGKPIEVDEWRQGKATMFVVEVKAKPVPAASILRQLRLYEEYLQPDDLDPIARKRVQLVAATTFKLPPGEAAMLRSQGVTVIWLGEPFRRWVEEQERAAHTTDDKPVEEF